MGMMEEVKDGSDLFATFDTTEGLIVVKLFTKEAPKTVENFVGLATGEKPWTHPATREAMKSAPPPSCRVRSLNAAVPLVRARANCRSVVYVVKLAPANTPTCGPPTIGSGLRTVEVDFAINCSVAVPAFTPGTTSPLVVTTTKIDQAQGASFELKVTDVAGNVVKEILA